MTVGKPIVSKYRWRMTNSFRVGTSGQSTMAIDGTRQEPLNWRQASSSTWRTPCRA